MLIIYYNKFIMNNFILFSVFAAIIVFIWIYKSKIETFESKIATYKGSKYDLTPFINKHPGGQENIMKAVGKDLSEVWKINKVSWHENNEKVMKQLKKLKI